MNDIVGVYILYILDILEYRLILIKELCDFIRIRETEKNVLGYYVSKRVT